MIVISRREFLRTGGAAALGLALGPTLFLRPARAAEGPGGRRKVLVHVFQRGGCDGLSAVVPHGEKRYYDLRRGTAIAPPGKPGGCLDLDGRFGLHPSLAPLLDDWKAGRLGIVHAIGSPDETRSHFDAQDFMETGTPGRKGTDDGWMNRYLAATGSSRGSMFRGVAITPTLPRCLSGEAKALAIASLDQFTAGGRGPAASLGETFGKMYGAREDDEICRSGTEAFEAVARLREIDPRRFTPENGAQYPRGGLGASLLSVAQLVKADVGVEVAFADVGGWDTHLNQGAAQGQLANRLGDLGQALHAFATDLGDRMQDVVVVTLTEFGRTAEENGTGGTDHGHGSFSLVLGGPVEGGKVHGKWPGLGEGDLWQKRDLAVTTDFRDLLAEALGRHLGTKDPGGVFPGHEPRRVGVLGRVA